MNHNKNGSISVGAPGSKARLESEMEDMSDNELWRAYREDQKRKREERLSSRTQEINQLPGQGYSIQWLSPYQCRINGELDLYPANGKYHNIKHNRRGIFRLVSKIVKEQL